MGTITAGSTPSGRPSAAARAAGSKLHIQHEPSPRAVAARQICGSNSYVDFGMIMSVGAAVPCFVMILATHYHCRSGREPLTVVDTKHGPTCLRILRLIGDGDKMPRLTVDSRGGETGGIDYGADQSALYRPVYIIAAA